VVAVFGSGGVLDVLGGGHDAETVAFSQNKQGNLQNDAKRLLE